jgi:hypothetical protein
MGQHSATPTLVVSCLIVVVGVVIALELKGVSGLPPKQSFYTTDDGQTWFVDSSSKLPPFDHDGAQAVRCYVFKGPNGKFAGLLEKYSDDTREQLTRLAGKSPPSDISVLVKKPGEKDWTKTGVDQQAMTLMHITGPDGSGIERVMP